MNEARDNAAAAVPNNEPNERNRETAEENNEIGLAPPPTNNSDAAVQQPPEMRLNEQETDSFWDLVARIEVDGVEEEDPEEGIRINPLTDFEYAMYAIVTGENTEDAARRVRGMQQFKETYNVQDTVEEGMTILEQFIGTFPGVLLHLDVMGPEGSVVAWDFGKLIPARIMACEEKYRILVLCMYYISRIHNPTLEVIREGVYYLSEGNISWENVDMAFETRYHHEFETYYPIKYKHFLVYNTNTVTNILFSLLKPFMTQEMRRVVRLGCEIDLVEVARMHNPLLHALVSPTIPKLKLQDVYFQPNYNVAMRNLLARARTLLEMRHHNERTFCLSI